MVPNGRVELPTTDYKSVALPITPIRLVRVTRFELATNAPKAFMLPLHYTHIAGNPIYYSLGFAFKARFVFSYATISGTPVGLCTHPTYYPVTCMNFAPMRESNSPASAVPLR